MHLPDAFVSPATALALDGVAVALGAVATVRVARDPALDRKLPLMAAVAALVFALRLVRFPIVGTGACGHVVGGLLAAIVVGPEAAFLVLLAVQGVQAVVFADGGLLAVGVNALNAALWPAWIGLRVYRSFVREGARPGVVAAGAVAGALVSLELGAAGVAIAVGGSGIPELASGRFLWTVALAHVPMAVVEGLVTTALVLLFRLSAAGEGERAERGQGSAVLVLFAVALFAAGVLADFASTAPEWPAWSLATLRADALEPTRAVAAAEALQRHLAVLPGYRIEGSSKAGAAWTTVAGLFGAVISAALALAPGLLVRAARSAWSARAAR